MRFRLIVDIETGRGDGAWNMAVDEALMDSAMESDDVATLRLYRFDPPAVTFGYHQKVERALDEDACRSRGIEYVRRVTGGRALLHQHELTYSVTAPPIAGSVRTTYESVTGAFRNALVGLGVPVDAPATAPLPKAPEHLPCLAVPTGHEITVRGMKLVASAMRFRRRGFLQHGSILWSLDRELVSVLTRLDGDQGLPATGLRELDIPHFGEETLIEALSSTFAELFGATPERGALTPAEADRSAGLEMKYRSRAWTNGRFHAETPVG